MNYKEVEGIDENGNPTTFKIEIPQITGLQALNLLGMLKVPTGKPQPNYIELKERCKKEFIAIEKDLNMTQLVKRLFKDANLRDYKYLCRSDKKLCSEEEWNKFREWIKE